MLLPQSSAFVSLRNRLNAVNSAGFLHIAPKSYVCQITRSLSFSLPGPHRTAVLVSTRSKIGQNEIKWQDLLNHFRAVQAKHEKARRQALGAESLPFAGFETKTTDPSSSKSADGGSVPGPSMRRRMAGADPTPAVGAGVGTVVSGRPALSPLNPRARQNGLLSTGSQSFTGSVIAPTSGSSLAMQQQKQRRAGLPVTLGPRKS